MNRLLIAVFATAIITLAGCGGGGGSSPSPVIPVPSPTQAPVTKYVASLLWTGGATQVAQATLRNPLGLREPQTATFATPVLLVAPLTAQFAGSNGSGALLLVQTNPSPTPTIVPSAVTYTLTAPNVTPAQTQATTPSGFVSSQNIVATTPAAASSGNATAIVPAPVASSPTTPLIVYKRFTMGCNPAGFSFPEIPGVVVTATGDTNENDVQQSDDLYITGHYCPGAFFDPAATSTDNPILHAPYGAVVVPLPAGGFSAITAAQWSNATTTVKYADLAGANAVLYKTFGGKRCKTMLVFGGLTIGQSDVQGPNACEGTAPDGF